MRRDIAVFQIERRKMLGQIFEIGFKWFGIGIKINENKAAPCANARFGKVHLVLINMREIPLAGNDR